MHTPLCVCPPKVESVFPPDLSKSCNQIPVAFKVWFSRNSSSCCRTPWLGSLTWGSEPSLQWVNFCGISVLQSVSHPPSSYGTWFYCDCTPPTVSLWLLLCPWMWGISLVSSSVFLLMIVQQLVVILVLLQEEVRARPSGYWILSKVSSASIDMFIWFLIFYLLMWYITLIDLWILKNSCITGINPTWSWCMILLMYCWIQFASILLRIFASIFISDISL